MNEVALQLEFQRKQLEQSANDIRRLADENRENRVVDRTPDSLGRALDQSARRIVDAWLNGAFLDPKIGYFIGRFAVGHVEEFANRRFQATSKFRELLKSLLRNYWYPRKSDTAIGFESEGRTLTEQGFVDRWHQETIDNANLIDFLTIQFGAELPTDLSEHFETLSRPIKDFSELHFYFGALGAIGSQHTELLTNFKAGSDLLLACYPYDDDLAKARQLLLEAGSNLQRAGWKTSDPIEQHPDYDEKKQAALVIKRTGGPDGKKLSWPEYEAAYDDAQSPVDVSKTRLYEYGKITNQPFQ